MYTFSMKSSEVRTELFSIYDELDEEIIKEASKYDLYLIGGTAIEIWLNHLGIKGWRKRSNNDLDFLINKASNDQMNKFKDYLRKNGFTKKSELNYNYNEIEIDFLEVLDEVNSDMFKVVNSIKLMSPIFLFTSKFNRISVLFCKNRNNQESDRYIKDLKDLKDLIKVIKKLKLDKNFDEALEYFYEDNKESDKIKLIEEFIDKELDK